MKRGERGNVAKKTTTTRRPRRTVTKPRVVRYASRFPRPPSTPDDPFDDLQVRDVAAWAASLDETRDSRGVVEKIEGPERPALDEAKVIATNDTKEDS
jgi:hypothetical protein